MPTHKEADINKETGLSVKAIEVLTFLNQSPVKGFKRALEIINELLSIQDFSINFMNEINNCIGIRERYIKEGKLLDELHKETKGDSTKEIQLRQTEKYINALYKREIEGLKGTMDLKIYQTQIHFMNILESLLPKPAEKEKRHKIKYLKNK